jgi:hypothetical protein
VLRFNIFTRPTAFLLLFAATSAQASPVGLWYCIGQPHDPDIVTQDQFNEDGTFRFEYRKYEDCKLVYRAVELGHWTQEGDVVSTYIETLDGKPAFYVHRYIYAAVNENEMHLHHIGIDYTFVERHDDRFQASDCWVGA